MTEHSSDNDKSDSAADLDYESVGADIVVTHAREEMQTRVSALRRSLKTAFSGEANPPPKPGGRHPRDDRA
jgi:hypothetical protein